MTKGGAGRHGAHFAATTKAPATGVIFENLNTHFKKATKTYFSPLLYCLQHADPTTSKTKIATHCPST
jgi:hypothetical protein